MKITKHEWYFVISILLISLIFTSRKFLLFLDSLTTFQGLMVYYILLYVTLFILSKLGLVIYHFKIDHPLQIIGMMLIFASFFTIFNFENPYVNYVAKGELPTNVTGIYFQSEDGALWNFFESRGITDIKTLYTLTFLVSPAVLSLIGVLLLNKKPRFD